MTSRESLLAGVLVLALAPSAWAATAPAPAAAEAPLTADSLAAQARAASARGETDLAMRLAQSAIVANPARTTGYDTLADVYAANHQPDFARAYYNAALAIDPTDSTATNAIAALDRAGDTRKADASDGAKPGAP